MAFLGTLREPNASKNASCRDECHRGHIHRGCKPCPTTWRPPSRSSGSTLPRRCVASADRYSSRLPSGGRLVTLERRWALADSPDASGRTTPKAMTDVVWLGRNGRVVVQARREIAYCFNHSLLGCAGAVHKLSLGHQGRRQGCTGPTDPATGVALDPCELVPRLAKLWRNMRGAVPPEPRHQPITRHGLR